MSPGAALPIVLIAYGGHGVVAASAMLAAGQRVAGYLETGPRQAPDPFGLAYLGTEESYFAAPRGVSAFVAVGDNRRRQSIAERFIGEGKILPCTAVVHPSAYVGPGVHCEVLSLICAGAVVQPLARVGRGAIVNTLASVDHECEVGAFAHVAPRAVLAGNAVVGAGALVGVGAVVLPGSRIGEEATLGAGSVLTRDLPAGETWVGNPARPISRR